MKGPKNPFLALSISSTQAQTGNDLRGSTLCFLLIVLAALEYVLGAEVAKSFGPFMPAIDLPRVGPVFAGHVLAVLVAAVWILPARWRLHLMLGAAVSVLLYVWPAGALPALVTVVAVGFVVARPGALWWRYLLVLAAWAWLLLYFVSERQFLLAQLMSMVVGLRVLLFIVERPRLEEHERGLLRYLVYILLPPFVLVPSDQPVGPKAIWSSYLRVPPARVLRDGLILLLLALVALVLRRFVLTHWVVVGFGGAASPELKGVSRIALLGSVYATGVGFYFLVVSYCFMMIGHLRLFGFALQSGFKQPFLSTSFLDFWSRWNTYIKDALSTIFYYPILGSLRRRLPIPLAVAIAGVATIPVANLCLHEIPVTAMRLGPDVIGWEAMQRMVLMDTRLSKVFLVGVLTSTQLVLLATLGEKIQPRVKKYRPFLAVLGAAIVVTYISLAQLLVQLEVMGWSAAERWFLIKRAFGA